MASAASEPPSLCFNPAKVSPSKLGLSRAPKLPGFARTFPASAFRAGLCGGCVVPAGELKASRRCQREKPELAFESGLIEFYLRALCITPLFPLTCFFLPS